MSFGGEISPGLDTAVSNLVNFAGIPAVVTAGNDNADALASSPARVDVAITVGASDINDTKASFSNYGAVVDIWAPGAIAFDSFES